MEEKGNEGIVVEGEEWGGKKEGSPYWDPRKGGMRRTDIAFPAAVSLFTVLII
jgi:hypothetical protein